ncbi:MAG: twin-arginine translocase subunit TatC [Planctomycetota bacterium]|nr:twin-arginine translocase subunit TatC [Planctomycetota bacterium]RLS41305.1 MAG: preprotein translocase subunit TatC [Planctomycetota bacterium]
MDLLGDSDEYFAKTRMSFGEHLEELRIHLWRAILWLIGGMTLAFFFGKPILGFITAPVQRELANYREFRLVETEKSLDQGVVPTDLQGLDKPTPFLELLVPRQALEAVMGGRNPGQFAWLPEEGKALAEGVQPVEIADMVRLPVAFADPVRTGLAMNRALSKINGDDQLTTLSIQEPALVYIKVSMVAGFILASPAIFWEIWSFIAAGMYPHEKKYVYGSLPAALGLFFAGVLLCQFLVMPVTIKGLLYFNYWFELRPDPRLNEWLSFAILMPLVFGLAFQTPLVIILVERLGLVDYEMLKKQRRVAWFVMAFLATALTPTADLTFLMLLVPMVILFEIGLYIIGQKSRGELNVEAPERDEMVGA